MAAPAEERTDEKTRGTAENRRKGKRLDGDELNAK
jgi:hypothetical protein